MVLNMSFPFPFKPYDIQEKFMKQLYLTIENSKSGIFESPTGTGKSLSICCSALQWLRNHNKNIIDKLENEIKEMQSQVTESQNDNDWLQEEYEKIKKNQILLKLQLKLEKIKKYHEKYSTMKIRVSKNTCNSLKPKEFFQNYMNISQDIDNTKENIDEDHICEDGDLILDECVEKGDSDSEGDEILEEEEYFPKIYFSSRTHSQLSQFVGEIKRTIFKDDTRVVTLASRQHYCINQNVVRLKNVNLINERCLDMQNSKSKSTSVGDDGKVLKKNKTKACTACPFYNQTNINKIKEKMLCNIMDMEDLVKTGKEMKGCPYYASRAALNDAEIILVSHAGIVSAGARSGMSLKLKNNILIMDEAHGLSAALENAHCAPVNSSSLTSVKTYLKFYIDKYTSRLSSKNLLSLNQLSFVVGKLLGTLNKKSENNKHEEPTIMALEDFVVKVEIDHLNLRKLIEFSKSTRLAQKLHGFFVRFSPQILIEQTQNSAKLKKNPLEDFLKSMSKSKNEVITSNPVESTTDLKQNDEIQLGTSPGTGLYAILDFLQMLCDRSEFGRVLVQRGDDGTGQLKYLLLNPSDHFAEIVKQCRSVIVAGGTMEPISEFTTLLTGEANLSDNINVVKCDHVVPPENVLAVCLSKGPSNVSLNFTYENRMAVDLLNEVCRILRNICNVIPGGVVCFLPSYSYEQTLYDHMNSNGYLQAVTKKKVLYREPKSAAEVDQILSKYATSVNIKSNEQNGALLLSVVGGKLSEGLNFSDDLGRCVVVIGMPYPNIKSCELQEKMSYLNKSIGPGAGNLYYESLCMKAVNQCIGRAVRHANDYACVLLVDERYSRSHTASSLPSFVKKSLLTNSSFGKTMGRIAKFFNLHKDKKINNIFD